MTTLGWAPRLPDHWDVVPLNLVAKMGTGHTPDRSKPEYWEDCTIPWITLTDASLHGESVAPIAETCQHISEIGMRNSSAVLHSAGTVVLSRTASVGHSAIMGQPMATTQDFAAWTCGPRLDPRYLLLVLRAMSPEWERLAFGSTHRTIYMPDLESVRIPLPSLDEQRRIADLLISEVVRIDQIVDSRRLQLKLAFERSREFTRVCVAGGRSAEAVRTSIPWVPMLHPSGLLVPLQRILLLQRGFDLTDGQRRPGSIPVITTAGASGFHNRSIVVGPAVVVGRYGSAGSVHWIDSDCWPHNTTLYVKDFRGNSRRYCYHLLKSFPFEMEQERAAVPGINRNDVHRRVMPLLPRVMQDRAIVTIEAHEARLDAARDAINRSIVLLNVRRQALITAAVTGQIDVSTARGVEV